MSRHCSLVIAAPGYGKTTALEAEGTPWRAAELDPDALPSDSPLLIDDLDDLERDGQLRLLAAVGRRADLRIAARSPMDPELRAALRVPVAELGPDDLALDIEQVAIVLRDEHGVDDVRLALIVQEITAGWPALVHLVADSVRRNPTQRRLAADELAVELAQRGAAVATWLTGCVLVGLPPGATRALSGALELDPVCPELLPDDVDELARLRRCGLLVAHPRYRRRGALQVVPLVAAVMSRGCERPDDLAGPAGTRTTARWYEQHGYPLAAAAIHIARGRPDEAAALVETHGARLLGQGAAQDIVALGLDTTGSGARLVLAEALRIVGDVPAATRILNPLYRADPHDVALARRVAALAYTNGDFARVLAVCDGAATEHTVDGVRGEAVHLGAMRANALGALGHAAAARAEAAATLELAVELDDDAALADAHIAAANAESGLRREQHLAQALSAAERADDVLQQARILNNQADALMREAHFAEAAIVAERAVDAAARCSPPGLIVATLINYGDALMRTGRLEGAAFQFERAVDLCRRTGIGRIAMGLWGRAEVARRVGRFEQSRGYFDETIELATTNFDAQILVSALTGLTRLLLATGDTAGARECAARAVALAPPPLEPLALVARGWVAVAAGEPTAGREADAAVCRAREGGAADVLAAALELVAATRESPGERTALLGQALAIWDAAGAWPSADRIRVQLGRAVGASPAARADARAAAHRLLDAGLSTSDGLPHPPAEQASLPVTVQVLGGFDVSVNGRPVPLRAWKSRQARTLIKILVARRGQPVPRLELRELLWPDDDFDRTAHRLSVLLSAVRAVLDPSRDWPADHFVRGDNATMCLDLTHVEVDVEQFLRDATHAVRRDSQLHRAALAELDVAYRGDAFPDDIYDDWATGLREQARAVWVSVLRELAQASVREKSPHEAATVLLRLLEVDRYDERAYRLLVRTLVRAGRHGEARRVFDRWDAAMCSIDAPAPDRSVLAPR